MLGHNRRVATALVAAVLFTGSAAGRAAASWSPTMTAVPSGLTVSRLSGVSCFAEDKCVAVGDGAEGEYGQATSSEVFAESLAGTDWNLSETPSNGAMSPEFTSVSCASTALCVAVGATKGNPATASAAHPYPLIEAFNGTEWTLAAAPYPAGVQSAVLSSVSCPTSGFCAAVGTTETSTSERLLVEVWSGVRWRQMIVPLPKRADNGALTGVSCTSSVSCTAVGDYQVGVGHVSFVEFPLIERWNGTTWRRVALAEYKADRLGWAVSLLGVSCRGANCLAVGTASPQGNGFAAPIAVSVHGTRGSYVRMGLVKLPTHSPYKPEGELNEVSCTSPTACVAVGQLWYSSRTEPYLVRWNGRRFSRETEVGPSDSDLLGVSCVGATCVSVGYSGSAQIHTAFAQATD
jgi:hypothetical protein